MTEEAIHIRRIQTANVKKIIRVDLITPEGEVITIGGKNGAGKSSLIDSIEWALGGTRAITGQPVRDGQRKGGTRVTLSNGMVVTRNYDAATNKTTLKVTADGTNVRRPQEVIDALYGDLTFDPSEFERHRPQRQAEIVRELAGVDTTALDEERQRVFDARTDTNREHKRLTAVLDGMPVDESAPAEVSIAELTAELTAAHEVIASNDRTRATAASLKADVERTAGGLGTLDTQITEARQRLTQLEAMRAEHSAALDKLREDARQARVAASALIDPWLEPIKTRLSDAEEINARARAARAREQVAVDVRKAASEAERMTARIEAIDVEKEELLKAAKLPIDGLGFGWEGLTFNGLPFDQASHAERLRVSVAMGIALNPRLRIMLVRDGSKLDADALRMVAEMAREHMVQVFLEVVTRNERDADECSVVIEDGQLRASEGKG